MAPKGAIKGAQKQREISSFFFKVPKTAAADSSVSTPRLGGCIDQSAETRQRLAVREEVDADTQDVTRPAVTAADEPPERPPKRARNSGPQAEPDIAGEDPAPPQPIAQMVSLSQSPASQRPRPRCGAAKQHSAQEMHERFQRKLVEGTEAAMGYHRPGAAAIQPQKQTPLEAQVVELKKRHPGILLVIEVGYKFRFFGEDAEVAARVCNIFCYPDRNFMVASIPVPRLHVYVRRLVEAGHKGEEGHKHASLKIFPEVGVVRQMETAALKAVGDNRSAPFTRRLTATYTRATLEAGAEEDVGPGGAAGKTGSPGAWSNEGLSSHLVVVVEGAPPPGAPPGEAVIGLVAVETSTGDVLYSEFRDTAMRSELEARLMFAKPSDLVLATPLSPATARLLGAYANASAGLRSEHVPRSKYAEGGAQAAVAVFYTGSGAGGGMGHAKPNISKHGGGSPLN